MESVIQKIRGDELDIHGECQFCRKASVSIFGIINGKKYDGSLFRGFYICDEHREKLNSLLSGEYDIDEICLDRFKAAATKGLNLRR